MLNLQWFDFVGFVGVLLVLGAYAGQQMRKISGDGVMFPLINMLGAAGILVPIWYAEQMNWSVLFIETAWVAISAYGIWQAMSQRFAKPKA
ncbi:CBU_0592 family membrane protein [Arenimonas sp.]|uniref:CBU_0592 family membrane protein n=1 Tax=Arenimonas sp. TaxID=1872635 RepID=UPI0039E70A58